MQLVQGRVICISADRLIDRVNSGPDYAVLAEAEPAALTKAADIQLLAGMPAEVSIEGGELTPLQYLAEPVTQVLQHAAREQ